MITILFFYGSWINSLHLN